MLSVALAPFLLQIKVQPGLATCIIDQYQDAPGDGAVWKVHLGSCSTSLPPDFDSLFPGSYSKFACLSQASWYIGVFGTV